MVTLSVTVKEGSGAGVEDGGPRGLGGRDLKDKKIRNLVIVCKTEMYDVKERVSHADQTWGEWRSNTVNETRIQATRYALSPTLLSEANRPYDDPVDDYGVRYVRRKGFR